MRNSLVLEDSCFLICSLLLRLDTKEKAAALAAAARWKEEARAQETREGARMVGPRRRKGEREKEREKRRVLITRGGA